MKKYVVLLLLALIVFPMTAQETEPDPAVQEAKEEVAVVYDLGRSSATSGVSRGRTSRISR